MFVSLCRILYFFATAVSLDAAVIVALNANAPDADGVAEAAHNHENVGRGRGDLTQKSPRR